MSLYQPEAEKAVKEGVKETFPKKLRQASYSFISRSFTPRRKNTDIACVYPITDEEIIYADATVGEVVRYDLSDRERIWATSIKKPLPLDYDDVNERVLVGKSGGIDLLDATDGSVLRTIKPYGVIHQVTGLVWDTSDPDLETVIFAMRDKHLLCRYNFVEGEMIDTYGVAGESGSDYSHLHSPHGVDMVANNNNVYVCDTGNSRVLRIDLTDFNNVKNLMLAPVRTITVARWGTKQQNHRFIDVASLTGLHKDPVFNFAFWKSRRLAWSLPFQLEWARFNKSITKMWGATLRAYEADLRRMSSRHITKPDSFTPLNNETVTAASGWTSDPLPALVLGDISFNLFSNQAGDAYIEVPKEISAGYSHLPLWVPTDYSWIQYDHAAFSANEMLTYNFTRTPPVFRIRVEVDADATVTLRVNQTPR